MSFLGFGKKEYEVSSSSKEETLKEEEILKDESEAVDDVVSMFKEMKVKMDLLSAENADLRKRLKKVEKGEKDVKGKKKIDDKSRDSVFYAVPPTPSVFKSSVKPCREGGIFTPA